MQTKTPKSPCISYCKTENGICIGCHRTIEEIINWRTMTNEEKLAIIKRIEAYNDRSNADEDNLADEHRVDG